MYGTDVRLQCGLGLEFLTTMNALKRYFQSVFYFYVYNQCDFPRKTLWAVITIELDSFVYGIDVRFQGDILAECLIALITFKCFDSLVYDSNVVFQFSFLGIFFIAMITMKWSNSLVYGVNVRLQLNLLIEYLVTNGAFKLRFIRMSAVIVLLQIATVSETFRTKNASEFKLLRVHSFHMKFDVFFSR